MADLFCPNCGTKQTELPKFCFECGADLSAVVAKRIAAAQAVPAQAVAPPPAWAAVEPGAAAPPAPAWSVPASRPQFHAPASAAQPAGFLPAGIASARPTGITILAVLEAIGGVLGLYGAKVLWDDAEALKILSAYGYGGANNYALFALLSAAGAIAAFVLAWGLWQLRPWAWMVGVGLCVTNAVVYLLIAASYRDAAGSAIVSICIDGAILYYLNLNSNRALFGRPATTLLQPQAAGGPASGTVGVPGGRAPTPTGPAPAPWGQPAPAPTPWGPVTAAPPSPPPPPWAQPTQAPTPPPWAQPASPAESAQPPASPPNVPEPPKTPS